MTAEDKRQLQECIAEEAKRIHTVIRTVIGEKDLQIRTLNAYVADLENRLGEAERGRQDAIEQLAANTRREGDEMAAKKAAH